jgi:hypothetical protein
MAAEIIQKEYLSDTEGKSFQEPVATQDKSSDGPTLELRSPLRLHDSARPVEATTSTIKPGAEAARKVQSIKTRCLVRDALRIVPSSAVFDHNCSL